MLKHFLWSCPDSLISRLHPGKVLWAKPASAKRSYDRLLASKIKLITNRSSLFLGLDEAWYLWDSKTTARFFFGVTRSAIVSLDGAKPCR